MAACSCDQLFNACFLSLSRTDVSIMKPLRYSKQELLKWQEAGGDEGRWHSIASSFPKERLARTTSSDGTGGRRRRGKKRSEKQHPLEAGDELANAIALPCIASFSHICNNSSSVSIMKPVRYSKQELLKWQEAGDDEGRWHSIASSVPKELLARTTSSDGTGRRRRRGKKRSEKQHPLEAGDELANVIALLCIASFSHICNNSSSVSIMKPLRYSKQELLKWQEAGDDEGRWYSIASSAPKELLRQTTPSDGTGRRRRKKRSEKQPALEAGDELANGIALPLVLQPTEVMDVEMVSYHESVDHMEDEGDAYDESDDDEFRLQPFAFAVDGEPDFTSGSPQDFELHQVGGSSMSKSESSKNWEETAYSRAD